MSNYSQTTFFAPKDALLTGNPLKLIRGADIDPELAAISVAIATKLDSSQAANPTGTVGLAAVNGVASTYMRSDGAPALSVAISPTWSGTHTFSNAITVNGAGTSLKGGVTIAAPTSGVSLTVNGVAGTQVQASFIGAANNNGGILIQDGQTGTRQWTLQAGVTAVGSFDIRDATAPATRMSISASGAVTINAPTSGNALDVTALAGGAGIVVHGAAGQDTVQIRNTAGSSAFGVFLQGGTNTADYALNVFSAVGTNYFKVRGDGLVTAIDDGGTMQTVGWRDQPVNSVSGGYTPVLADRGKLLLVGSGNVTVPANSVTAFPSGTTISIYNNTGGNMTISVTTDSLVLAGTGSTGSRTLAATGTAVLAKYASTGWVISGAGLS